MKWHENSELEELAQAADNALDTENCDELLKTAELCEEKSKVVENHPLATARFQYCAFTCYSNLIKLSKNIDRLDFRSQEKYIEKAIYSARNAYAIYNRALQEVHAKEDRIELIAFYSQLAINYSNLLFECGRIVESISVLSSPVLLKLPLVKGCLGVLLTHFAIPYWDSSHKSYIFHRAYKLLTLSIERENHLYNSRQVDSFQQSTIYIESLFRNTFLSAEISCSDYILPFENLSETEEKYRKWIAENNLALHLVNDIEKSIEVAYDPLWLPTMIGDLKTQKPATIQSLFNQLKQEYVSARYTVYEGISEKEVHYSDKGVLLINTLDFPLYCLSLEKVKFGFRACYSILDSIAFLMNEYFNLNIPERFISFASIWKNHSKKHLLELAKDNSFLTGMWWLYKDIRSSYTSEYKPNTEEFSNIVKIRNAMEHRSLKIVRFNINLETAKKLNPDKASYMVSFEEFESLTLKLFKCVREAIILLLFAIKLNEEKQEKSGFIMPIISNEYPDDEKVIF